MVEKGARQPLKASSGRMTATNNVKKIFATTLVLTVLGVFLLLQNQNATEKKTRQTAMVVASVATSTPSGFVPVVRVIDGDTIVVSIADADEIVRFLGVDTPEVVDPRKPVQCFGKEASVETKSLLDDQSVRLVADPTQANRDKYGRLLRYVYLPDGTFVDELLVRLGFAREYTYENKPYKFQTEFRADQASAQATGLGLWSVCHS